MSEFEFQEVFFDAQKKYERKKAKYGESWKKVATRVLDFRLYQEMDEYTNSATNQQEYDELLDVINVAAMIAKRIKMEQKGEKK